MMAIHRLIVFKNVLRLSDSTLMIEECEQGEIALEN
jgi:hypothetical protein